MKIKHLLIGMLAVAAAVACKQDEPVEEPVLEVNKTAVALAATAAEGTFEVTANNAWSADADADWVSLDPANGAGGEKAVVVKVTAEDNTAEARTATVTVKSGNLTRTLKVAQAAAAAGPGDDVDPDAPTYILVGEAVGGWNVDQNGVVLTLKDGYYQAKGVAVTAKKGMHFTKNNKWEGNVKGLHGLIAPNEIGEVGNNDISLTEDGLYDVYLTEALDKFYFMTESKLPSEAVEHKEISTVWGVCGSIEGNSWGASSDPEMTLEDEWYVAKNITFTEVNLKIRGNNSWADDLKWGTATKNQTCELNKAVAVSTCTEFKEANPGEPDNPNIYIAAPAGAYDVYFSPEKKEVWVMTPGYKPGDETPEAPVEPEKETAELVTFLSFTSNVASGQNTVTVQLAAEGLSMETVTSDWGPYDQLVGAGKYLKFDAYSADGTLAAGTYTASAEGGKVNEGEFSIGYDTTVDWGFGPMEMTNWGTCWMTHNADGSETGVKVTDGTITVAVEGDVYTITLESSVLNATYVGKLSKDAGETPEPEQPELEVSTWALVGSFNGWDAKSDLYLSVLDENYFVYYGFDMPAGGEFKFLKGGAWPQDGGVELGGNGLAQPNTIQPAGGSNIKVTEAGKYDIYLAADLSKFYIMSEGKLPSEATEPAPVENTWGMMGCFVDNTWAKDVPMTKEGEWIVAKGAQFTELTFKIRANESWADATNIGLAPGSAKGEINTKVSVVTAEYAKANLGGDAADIKLNGEAGTYDVYFSYEKLELYVMTPGLKPGETPAAPADVDIDGKQWVFTWSALNASCVIDLGVTEPGVAILAYDMAAVDPEYAGIYFPYMIGTYEITKTDGTSGVVAFTDIDYGETINIPYSNATENSVHFESEALLEENVDCTLATSKIEISMESAEYLADGEYWIIANDKVATPLTSNYGYLQVTDAIDGKSYAANAFTFTQVEEGVYTIQDANGKYYYQTGSYNSFNVSATDGGTDEYLWEVYDTGNGQYAIINYETGKYIQFDSQYGTYGCYMEEKGAMPTLVLADEPIKEPEAPAEYTSNVKWTLGDKAYAEKATINGNANVDVLKLGTGDAVGTAKITIPAGTTKVGFYGVAWNGKSGKLTASVGGTTVYEQALQSNSGAANKAPYTITVADTDYYEMALPAPCEADTVVDLSTVSGATRVILWGIKAHAE